MRAEIGFVLEFLDEITIGAREEPPVEITRIVPRAVGAILGKLDGKPVKRAAMQPMPKTFDHRPRPQLEVANRHQRRRIEKRGGSGGRCGGHYARDACPSENWQRVCGPFPVFNGALMSWSRPPPPRSHA